MTLHIFYNYSYEKKKNNINYRQRVVALKLITFTPSFCIKISDATFLVPRW